MKRMIRILCLGLLLCSPLYAQKAALKTNLLYDATATPNLGLEFALAPRWTLAFSAGINPFAFNNNRKWKHWLTEGEVRYWLCERFYGHFFGLHVGGGEFNVGRVSFPWPKLDKTYRYEGWAALVGASYGYSWVLGKRWNLEATIGFGIMHADYKRFDCPHCGEYEGKSKETFFSPTRAGVSLIYMIK